MGYNESIPDLVSSLWKLRDLLDIFTSGETKGVTITKVDFKTKASTLETELTAKITQVTIDITEALK